MNNSHSSEKSPNEDNFKEIKENTFKEFSNIESICKKFDYYTTSIQGNHSSSMLNESSCIYLYYWLYYYKNEKRNIENVKKLYKALIKADSTSHQNLCPRSGYTKISDDEMSKLKDLHDMYTYLNNIQNNGTSQCNDKCSCAKKCADLYMKYKNACESNNNSGFCNELKNVTDKYNALSTTKCSGQLTYIMLPLFKRNHTSVRIAITIFVILLISITLLVVHKFTPYISCFQGTLRRKRNKWNNIDEDYDIFQSYNNESNSTIKSRHHILYLKD